MPAFRRADTPAGPLNDLLDALHELHLAAGHPSTRTLQRDIGGDVASHSAIHKIFTGTNLPTWGLVELLVETMARRAHRDVLEEVRRIHGMWVLAANPVMREKGEANRDSRASKQHPVGGGRKPLTMSTLALLPDLLDEIEAVGSLKAAGNFRIPTGFGDLDSLLGGWARGSLIVVGGRPSCGKTTLLLDFCRAASIKYGIPSMFMSGEMNSAELQTRILSAEALVSLHSIRTGQMSEDDWMRIARTLEVIADAPIMMSSAPAIFSAEQITSEAETLAGTSGLKLVIIDGLNSMESEKSFASDIGRGQYIEFTLRELKKLAEAARLPVIISAQAITTSGATQRTPELGDLTHADAIERVADIVILINRPDQDYRNSPRAGEADLIVWKNRLGPTATVTVACQGHYARFVEMFPTGYPVFPSKVDRETK